MLKTDGALRSLQLPRLSRTAFRPILVRLRRGAIRLADAARLTPPTVSVVTRSSLRASLIAVLRPFTTAERTLPVVVGAIVAIASLLAVVPNTSQGAVGGTQGHRSAVRLAVGGGLATGAADGTASVDQQLFVPLTIPGSNSVAAAVPQGGTILDDGTLLTGYAPQTTVEDGSALIKTYKVKSGDTLVAIAAHYGVSMMTVYWANKLTSKDSLHVGQTIRIPPVNGLVVTVTATDTLDTLAAKYKVQATDIYTLNQLTDPTLVVGQVLIVPGAKGAAIPVPKPTVTHTGSGSGGSYCSSCGVGGSYSGGKFAWPVIGGNNYISQYFHYGHEALDIAAAYGSPVVAAAAGTVTFAGWGTNGGGFQVWISHGGGMSTTYNHMSAVLVHVGQVVARGQQVGRIGMTGIATGPHVHFEVWFGPVDQSSGYRVNPLRYY